MAYTKLGLKDGDKVKATHVDHIEDGIDELNTELANKADRRYYNGSVADMLSNWAELTNLRPFLFAVYGSDLVSFLTGGQLTSSVWIGILFRNGSNYDYFIYSNNSYAFFGRVATDTVTSLRRITLDSMSLS